MVLWVTVHCKSNSFPFDKNVNFINNFKKNGNQHFLLVPECFLPFQGQKISFTFNKHIICCLENALNLVTILLSGKELNILTGKRLCQKENKIKQIDYMKNITVEK